MKNTKLLLTLAIAIPCLFSCNKESKFYVTFHQELAEDYKVEFTKSTLQSEIEAQEPDIFKKEGYNSAWEDYSIEGKTSSFTVNALYDAITYYASFKAQGVLVENVPFTINDINGENSKLPSDREPAAPGHDWADVYWEDYSLKLDNIVVNAKYDHLKEFTITFMANGTQIGDVVKYTRDDIDVEGKIRDSLIPQEVKDFSVEGKDVSWDFRVTEPGNLTISASIFLHPYYIKFVDFEGNQIGDLVSYTTDNDTWESVNKPAAPELEGYDTSWNEATLTYSDTDIVVATPKKVGKEYFISFEGFEGTQTVRYGEPYELEHKTLALHKWANGEEVIANKGIWNIASNVSLTLIDATSDSFDYDVVPDFIDVSRSLNLSSIEIVENEGVKGSRALKLTVNAKSDFGLKIKKEYLDDVFSDPNTKALTFVAKSSIHNNNFRHRTNATNVCYEQNDKRFGLETYYKKFSFTRSMYENHNDSTDFIVFGGQPDSGNVAGSNIYIDSFIFNEDDVMKTGPSKLSFENGSVDISNGNHYYYSEYFNGSSITNDRFFILPGSTQLTNEGHSSDFATDGASSLTFTKGNGYIALYMGQAFTKAVEDSVSKKVAFDIYSTVHVNSNGTVNNLTDGKNGNFANQGGALKANTWTTFVLDQNMYTASSDSGRFLIIQGSSAGTFYLDNFRILEA